MFWNTEKYFIENNDAAILQIAFFVTAQYSDFKRNILLIKIITATILNVLIKLKILFSIRIFLQSSKCLGSFNYS